MKLNKMQTEYRYVILQKEKHPKTTPPTPPAPPHLRLSKNVFTLSTNLK